jgi:hypothetical protein
LTLSIFAIGSPNHIAAITPQATPEGYLMDASAAKGFLAHQWDGYGIAAGTGLAMMSGSLIAQGRGHRRERPRP